MILRLLTVTTLALLVIAAPAQAAKGNKANKGARPDRALARFDRDHNGVIDGEEVARIQALFGQLVVLDTDKNGQLSETEVAAAKIPIGKAKAGKPKADRKKKTQ